MADERETQRKLTRAEALGLGADATQAQAAGVSVASGSVRSAAGESSGTPPDLTIGGVIARLRRLPPAVTVLTLGSIGSVIFMALSVTNHTTPVAVLLSAGVISGLIFAIDAAIAAHSCWSASVNGRMGRAILMAWISFGFMLVCAANLAGTTVLILVLNGWP